MSATKVRAAAKVGLWTLLAVRRPSRSGLMAGSWLLELAPTSHQSRHCCMKTKEEKG